MQVCDKHQLILSKQSACISIISINGIYLSDLSSHSNYDLAV